MSSRFGHLTFENMYILVLGTWYNRLLAVWNCQCMFNPSQRVTDHGAKFSLWSLLISNLSPKASGFKLHSTWWRIQFTSQTVLWIRVNTISQSFVIHNIIYATEGKDTKRQSVLFMKQKWSIGRLFTFSFSGLFSFNEFIDS